MNGEEKTTAVLPIELFEASGIIGHACNVAVGDGAIVIMKERMTAIEALKAFDFIKNVGSNILASIRVSCEPCQHCEGGCVYAGDELGYIDIPPLTRKLWEIPQDVKIRATLDEQHDRIILSKDGPTPDIRDVPKDAREIMEMTGVCLCSLDELIRSEIPVYDGEEYETEEE